MIYVTIHFTSLSPIVALYWTRYFLSVHFLSMNRFLIFSLINGTIFAVPLIKENEKMIHGKKWIGRQYHFRIMLMLNSNMWKCIVTKINFHKLSFYGPHSKPHGASGLSKHYHLRFDQKLEMGICAIIWWIIKILCLWYPSPMKKSKIRN